VVRESRIVDRGDWHTLRSRPRNAIRFRTVAEDPQLPGPVLSVVLLTLAAVLAYGATQIEPGYSYRLGHVSPLGALLVRVVAWVLVAFTGGGGALLLAYNLQRRRR
jgi:hypothetical protein